MIKAITWKPLSGTIKWAGYVGTLELFQVRWDATLPLGVISRWRLEASLPRILTNKDKKNRYYETKEEAFETCQNRFNEWLAKLMWEGGES